MAEDDGAPATPVLVPDRRAVARRDRDHRMSPSPPRAVDCAAPSRRRAVARGRRPTERGSWTGPRSRGVSTREARPPGRLEACSSTPSTGDAPSRSRRSVKYRSIAAVVCSSFKGRIRLAGLGRCSDLDTERRAAIARVVQVRVTPGLEPRRVSWRGRRTVPCIGRTAISRGGGRPPLRSLAARPSVSHCVLAAGPGLEADRFATSGLALRAPPSRTTCSLRDQPSGSTSLRLVPEPSGRGRSLFARVHPPGQPSQAARFAGWRRPRREPPCLLRAFAAPFSVAAQPPRRLMGAGCFRSLASESRFGSFLNHAAAS